MSELKFEMDEEPTPQPTPHGFYRPDDNAILESIILYYSLIAAFFFFFGLLRVYYPNSVILRVFSQQTSSPDEVLHQPIKQEPQYVKMIDDFVDFYCDADSFYSGGNYILKFFSLSIRPIKAFIFTTWKSIRMSEKEIISHCGLDAYLCLRLAKLCVVLLSKFSLIGLFVLFPLYISQEQSKECIDYCVTVRSQKDHSKEDDDIYSAKCLCTYVDRSSMAHIKAESSLLWIPALAMGLISIITLIDLREEFVSIIRIRREYWLSRPPQIYTIFVHRIPLRLQNAAKLRRYFDRLFPGKVLKVEMLCDLSEIQSVGDRRNRVLMALERAMALEKKGIPPDLWIFGDDSNNVHSNISSVSTAPLLFQEDRDNFNSSNLNSEFVDKSHKGCCESVLNSLGLRRVNAIHYYQNELYKLNVEFSNLRKKYDEDMAQQTIWRSQSLETKVSSEPKLALPYDIIDEVSSSAPPTPPQISKMGSSKWGPCMMAFVTFSQVTPATIAAQSILNIDANSIEVKTAPEPRDVRWNALHDQGTRFYFLRRLASRIIFLLILIFWGALTSLVGAATSIDTLSSKIPDLSTFLEHHPSAASWLNRAVTIIYTILLALVLPIIALLVKLEVRVAESNVVRAIGERYFLFLVVQLFLFYTIAGTLFRTLITIVDRPSNIISTLASTIPKNAAFYIDFITVKTFWSSIELVRGNDYILSMTRHWPLGFYGSLTERERRTTICGCNDFSYPGASNLHTISANILLVFFIATTYAVLQPWLLPAALMFMIIMLSVCSVRFKHQTRQLFDGGGTTWTHYYWGIVGALVTAQLTLVGTLLIKHGYLPAFSVFIMIFVFSVAAMRIQDKYRGHATVMPVEIAAELDDNGPLSSSQGSKNDDDLFEDNDIDDQDERIEASDLTSKIKTRNIATSISQSRIPSPIFNLAEEVGSELRLYNMQVFRNVVKIGKANNVDEQLQTSAIIDLETSDQSIEETEQERLKLSQSLRIPRVYQYLDPVLTEEDKVHPMIPSMDNFGHVFNVHKPQNAQ